MSEQELEKTIRDYILTLYKAEYTGYLEVKKNGSNYVFLIGLPSYMQPTSLGYDGDDEGFLEYIKEELRIRNYMRLEIYKVVKDDKHKRD